MGSGMLPWKIDNVLAFKTFKSSRLVELPCPNIFQIARKKLLLQPWANLHYLRAFRVVWAAVGGFYFGKQQLCFLMLGLSPPASINFTFPFFFLLFSFFFCNLGYGKKKATAVIWTNCNAECIKSVSPPPLLPPRKVMTLFPPSSPPHNIMLEMRAREGCKNACLMRIPHSLFFLGWFLCVIVGRAIVVVTCTMVILWFLGKTAISHPEKKILPGPNNKFPSKTGNFIS